MTDDPLARLATHDVPPLPEDFDSRVHERVNDALLGTHLVELVLRAAPWALFELARAGVGALLFTLTGSYPSDDRRKRRRDS